MQIVYVLRDKGQLRKMLGELCDSAVRVIRLRLKNLAPSPFVPTPAEAWVSAESLGSCELGWIEMLPQARKCISKRWNSTLGGHAGASKNHDMLGFSQVLRDNTDRHG